MQPCQKRSQAQRTVYNHFEAALSSIFSQIKLTCM